MKTALNILHERVAKSLSRPVDPAVAAFARHLANEAGANAALFYGSNLRTGSLDGVLDFYLLMPGTRDKAIWPRVSYHERDHADANGATKVLRAKVASMCLATFAQAAKGELADTTIWARFVQPSGLVWARDEATRADVVSAISDANMTAARLAAALGPERGTPDEYWKTLFDATYRAEFRVEKRTRSNDILVANRAHFTGLLPLALSACGIDPRQQGEFLAPALPLREKRRILGWWKRRRRLGKPLNLVRLVKATVTFDGAAQYAAWKIERHTGLAIEVTPLRERFPLIAAPRVLWALWRHRRRA